ncbi:MAG: pyrroline-5-carboxylate reductase family protein [Chitinivibrionales bacterium]
MSSLANHFGDDAHLCRVMPNTPALIGEGVSAYALSSNCDEKDGQTVERVMGCCGKVLAVAETLLDAVTGVSGSGPAYVYRFIEALIEGGITAGLPPKIARECAVQTVIGAAKMVQCSQTEPAELKHNVMSAGGTTAYGLLSLEENGFAFSVMKAILAATERSRELGKK